MNHIQLLAHSLASRVPAMAQDCAINNAYMMEKEIAAVLEKELADREQKPQHASLVLQIIHDLKLMGQALAVIESTIRDNPQLFECANDYIVMKIMADRCQNGGLAVNNAISWAHGEKYGRPEQPPLPEPPEFQYCPHCQAQLPYTYPKTNCPKCGKRLHEPNAFVELMRKGKTKELSEVHADIDATE